MMNGCGRVHWAVGGAAGGRAVGGPALGPVVVGYDGTAASLRAVTDVATTHRSRDIVLVTALRRRRRGGPPGAYGDALKSEAYLLTAAATTDEMVRRGREVARAAGATSVVSRTGTGDVRAVLAGVTADLGATTVVLGMSGRQPGALARALHRTLAADVDLVVTDGFRHLRAEVTRPAPRPYLPSRASRLDASWLAEPSSAR
ncbi:universal stress protein [Gordonia sp. CPCC 205515]|uniref:universal stress protein n=1 Tax=Gordonia sp. CPCC 205515 TaxID=3140791 RepID=UPI003AF3420E